YDEQGTPLFHGHRILGKEDGEWTYYYPDGSPKQRVNYREGIKLGPFEDFYPNKQPKTQCTFNYVGQLEGVYIVWDEQGGSLIEGQFQNGTRTGKWTYTNGEEGFERVEHEYAPNGIIQYERKYPKAGGNYYEFIARNDTHGLDSTGAFDGLFRTGYWRIYGGKGIYIKAEGNFEGDDKEGEWKYWSDDHVLLEVGSYHLGEKVGLWKITSEDQQQVLEQLHETDGIRNQNYWDNGKQTLQNGKGFIDSYGYLGEEMIKIRTYYRKGLSYKTKNKKI
ncbi:MAG: hypothetical protein AAFV78_17150, partial [Bacteroidota bacterium]